MTELLDVRPGARVLEIGTGSGYHTAILLELGARVTSVERLPGLAERARAVLRELEPDADVVVHVGDGSLGWRAGAPYDRVLVAAAAPHMPRALAEQLADGGRAVLPLGTRDEQVLTVIRKDVEELREERDIRCRFVPLLGDDGWR